MAAVFIDGTKIEANANKYSFEKLYAKINEAGVVMVHGKSQRKTQLQRVLEQVEAWLEVE